jgi:hypothetical protein
VTRRERNATTVEELVASGIDRLEVPAFLRKQAD